MTEYFAISGNPSWNFAYFRVIALPIALNEPTLQTDASQSILYNVVFRACNMYRVFWYVRSERKRDNYYNAPAVSDMQTLPITNNLS